VTRAHVHRGETLASRRGDQAEQRELEDEALGRLVRRLALGSLRVALGSLRVALGSLRVALGSLRGLGRARRDRLDRRADRVGDRNQRGGLNAWSSLAATSRSPSSSTKLTISASPSSLSGCRPCTRRRPVSSFVGGAPPLTVTSEHQLAPRGASDTRTPAGPRPFRRAASSPAWLGYWYVPTSG
jgi:hypothetical protein